jgi:tetratricopeptide (TPR) repeat protein
MNGTLTLRHGVVILATLLLAAPLVAQDRIADEKALEQIYLDPALAGADYDAHLKTLVSVIDAAPATVTGVTALRRAMRFEDRCAGMRPLYAWLAARVGDNFKACGIYAEDYCQAYIDLARKYSSDLLWQEVARKWRGVTEWSYIGPFTEGMYPAHDDMFGPEVLLDFAAQYDGGHGTVAWQPVRHYDPLGADINLWTQQRWPGGGYYLCTALVSDAPREVLLRVDLNAAGKIWINGRLAADLDTRRREWSEATFNATLNRGRNLLLVKVSTLSSVTAIVRAADGGLVEGVVAVAPKAGDPRAVIQQGKAPEGNFLPGEAELQRTAGWRGATARSSALAWLALSSLYDVYSLRWEGMEAIEHALDLLQDSEPLARLEYLRTLDRSPLHSSSERRRLRREITDALLSGQTEFIPGVSEKAELLGEDQRYADAVKLLESAREKAPENWRITLALADVFRDANWQSECLRELNRARTQAPTAIPVLRALARYHSSNQELANRIAVEREVLKLMPGDRDAHIGLCNTLLRTGDGTEALKHARTLAAGDPGNTGSRENLAETLVATGKLDEACAVYEALANEHHRPEEYLQKAARACLQLGNPGAAERYYEQVLQASPGQHGARRQLQRMRGESEDFWSGHAMAWDEAMKHDVTAEQFPRAGSALVLDEQVQVMYADGSSASYIHQVRKILTQDGVDERGKERVSGELVTARTVLPDGTVLEPIRQSGGLVEFPGVKVGCYIDIAYISRGEPSARATLDGHRFFFSDNAMDEPFAISRWVLVAPRQMRLTPILHNMTNGEDGVSIESRAEGDDIVRVWDVRNPRHPDFEPFMPPALEFIPWIEFVTSHDWRERARKLADEALGDTRVTGLIRAKADELVHGVDGDQPRARAINSWVNENFPTSGDAWNAHQALKAGAGDRRELFIALCTAAGIELGFAYADAAPRYKQPPEEGLPRPHWAYPRDEDFTTLLVVVRDADGKPTYVDLDSESPRSTVT